MRSLLWTFLSLVATISGVPQGFLQPAVQTSPRVTYDNVPAEFCELYDTCTQQAQPPSSHPPLATRPSPPDDEVCHCVPSSQCGNSTTTTNVYKKGLIVMRQNTQRCKDSETCCRKEDIIGYPKPTPFVSTCGKRNPAGIGFRITGNKDDDAAQYAEFPWMVAVVRPDTTLKKEGRSVSVFVCGGSLIHPQVVLTAAHCVDGKSNLIARAGEWNTQSKNEQFPTQNRNVRQVIVHEQFFKTSLLNDVALLILEHPVDMSLPNVGTICLPDTNENMDNRNCVASGWGKDVNGRYQAILKKVDLRLVPRSRCQEALRQTRLGPNFNLHESFVCAASINGKDACKGDGGSPLVCPSRNNPDVYVQAGIVSWGIGCDGGTPGVYVDVPHVVNWVHSTLQSYGISLYS